MRFFILIISFFLLSNTFAFEGQFATPVFEPVPKSFQEKHPKLYTFVLKLKENKTDKNVRLIAAGLTITLGVFGAHRLYLGTAPKVPAVYSLTLGGGIGVLPLVDLILILSTKDLEKFYNSNKVFMWTTPQ